jgi:hypothetical protein
MRFAAMKDPGDELFHAGKRESEDFSSSHFKKILN